MAKLVFQDDRGNNHTSRECKGNVTNQVVGGKQVSACDTCGVQTPAQDGTEVALHIWRDFCGGGCYATNHAVTVGEQGKSPYFVKPQIV